MSERIVGKGTIVRIFQEEYDDSIQDLVIELEDGTIISQRREWPDLVYRGEKSSDSAHNIFLYELKDAPPDIIYAFVDSASKLLEGPRLVEEDHPSVR